MLLPVVVGVVLVIIIVVVSLVLVVWLVCVCVLVFPGFLLVDYDGCVRLFGLLSVVGLFAINVWLWYCLHGVIVAVYLVGVVFVGCLLIAWYAVTLLLLVAFIFVFLCGGGWLFGYVLGFRVASADCVL